MIFQTSRSFAVFIHRSIKTRIETQNYVKEMWEKQLFLYIDPLKQGLKQIEYSITGLLLSVFIHRSIKTRIETS